MVVNNTGGKQGELVMVKGAPKKPKKPPGEK
jgi:hypothetical protein